MDREWITLLFPDPLFEVGVETFLDFAHRHLPNRETIKCPCRRCGNQRISVSYDEVKHDLLKYGFMLTYKIWNFHGEVAPPEVVEHVPSFQHKSNDACTNYLDAVLVNSIIEELEGARDETNQDEMNAKFGCEEAPKDDPFIEFENVQCPKIIEKVENNVKSNPEASKTNLNDALSQTLGKDSRGHMRGLGPGVSMTLFKSSSHMVEKNIDLLIENNTTILMVEKLQRDMQELKDAFKKIQSTPHTGRTISSPRSVGPVTQLISTQRLDTCNIGKACKVYSWPHVEVAEGEIVEVDSEVLVHHVSMGEGNYKIWLIRILNEKALLFKGDANVRTLDDVGRGGYVVWPKNFLEIEK